MPVTPVADTPERVLQRIDWHVLKRLDGMLQGDFRTLLYGIGTDFADLREYQPHDDVRRIDWNVTARLNEPFVRQYVEDRELTAWFLVDRSPSMNFGATERTKQLLATELVTALARLLTKAGNRVGAVLYDNAVELLVEPKSSRNQVLRLSHELLHDPTPSGEETDLAGLLEAGAAALSRRSLVFVLSDFLCAPGWGPALAQLTERHEIIPIRLVDPRETELPDVGVLAVQDSETGEQLMVDTSDPVFRRRYHEAALAREERLQTEVARSGVELFGVSTDDDLVHAFVRLAEQRKARLRR